MTTHRLERHREYGYTGASYGMLRARATEVGPWEKFQILDTKTLQPVYLFFPRI